MTALAPTLAALAVMSADPTGTTVHGDARVSFTATDDVHARDRPSGAPGIIMTRPRRTFFDDHDEVDVAFTTAPHLMVLGEVPRAAFEIDAQVALVGTLAVSNGSATLRDASSYLKLWRDFAIGRLLFIAFPFGADRMRLGYSDRLSWGDEDAFRDNTLVPGARFELIGETAYAHLGVKTSTAPLLQRSGSIDRDNVWGVLGGAGWDLGEVLLVEAAAAYFFRGTLDRAELAPAPGSHDEVADWTTTGASLQVTLHPDLPAERSTDFLVFERDPFVRDSLFEAPVETSGLHLRAEATVLRQPLQDPRRLADTISQYGVAGDVEAMAGVGPLRLALLVAYRNLAFLLFDVPGSSFADFPVGTVDTPEISGAVSAEVDFTSLGVSLLLGGGLLRPASLRSGAEVVVHRGVTASTVLPAGGEARAVFEAKAGGVARLSDHLAAALEVLWAANPNDVEVRRDEVGLAVRERREQRELWVTFVLRGRL